MIIRGRSSLLPPLVAALVLAVPGPEARACGYSEPTLFVSPYAPDTPLDRFAAGELGVLQPTWARAYLAVAYRNLAGLPLGKEERSAVLAYWKGEDAASAGGSAWTAARTAATGQERLNVNGERWVGFTSYVNCGDDAFRRAAETLQAYVGRYGKDAPETRSWLSAQEVVFSNCSDEKPAIPDALPASSPAPLRADRDYQIASASFYAGRLEAARERFDAIANDATSPWGSIAPYLAARAVLRQATLGDGERSASLRLLTEARRRLLAVRDGASTAELRRWSEGLLRFVDLRLDPEARVAAAADDVLKPPSEPAFAVSLRYYRDLLFRVLGFAFEGRPGYRPDPSDDLTSWIVAFQTTGAAGLELALEGWTRTHTGAWLAATLAKIPPDHPRYAEIAEAARRYPRTAPGGLHVAYHLADLETRAGRNAEARKIVSESIARARAAGESARNLFLDLELRNAATFEEFVSAAPRRAVYGDSAGGGEVFDEAGQAVLDRYFPLDLLVRFFEESSLEPSARENFRKVVLSRAVLLGRRDVAQRMEGLVAGAPSLGGPEWRVGAALDVLLKDSGMRPYVVLDPDFSIAWWCPMPAPKGPGSPPRFLTPADGDAARKELAALDGIGAAASWFCREALAFADRRPDDPRAPEFLAGAVRATREGCADAETRALSKAAFRRLHARYPDSPWAKRTKFWFEGRGWYPPPPAPAPPPS